MRNFLDTAEQKLCAAGARVDRRLLAAVSLAALACMLLAHGFAFANLFPNHDSTIVVYDAQWTMYVLGSTANVVADQAQLDQWAEDPRVQAMPAYPEGEYCAMIDGTAVIRIS